LVVFLLSAVFPPWLGWRLAFGIGAVLALLILLVRRHVPESPRWLFIHGREGEAERIVEGIEREVTESTGDKLDEPEQEIKIRQRRSIGFIEIAKTAIKLYPKRTVLGLALFVGQAFIYNGITFNLGTVFSGYFGTPSQIVPLFLVIYAVGNFLGPVVLGPLFDTVGRRPMITIAYLGSAVLTVPLTAIFFTQWGGEAAFIVAIGATFFLASSGASAAYLTVSEIFPMETRALAIAFFYAIGTGLGGIVGPLLFGSFIESGDRGLVSLGFLIAGGVMAIGGIAELFLGVRAERTSLEDIAKPMTAVDEEPDSPSDSRAG
jgi:MFS family permease